MVILIITKYRKRCSLHSSNTHTHMKPFVTGLIVCSVAILFVLWNRRFIFGGAKKKTKTKTKISSAKSIKLPAAVSNEEDATAMLLSELLSLNRAAHVLANSGGLLDKLLKLEKTEACEVLLRDYELSSVMVLIKHNEEEDMEGEQEEGYKKIDEIKKPDSNVKAKAKKVDETKKSDSKDKGSGSKDLDSSNDSDSNHHHSTNDPLRIALFCKNLGRPPRIGRVVRIVESESEKADKYIIELVK